ncbi:MAG: hypothetical protein KF680_06475 [Cryobacterium sp.]|nr:hypothetical protein [Cryobacterium sp.]
MMLERTRQQLDPVGANDVHRTWVLLCIATLGFVVLSTVRGWAGVAHPQLAISSVAVSAGAMALVLVWTSAASAPFTGNRHLAVHSIMLVAMALSAWSRYSEADAHSHDPFPFAIGALAVVMSNYRPAQEIVVLGITSATIAGFLVLVEASETGAEPSALAHVLPAVTPILALSFGAAAFTGGIVTAIEDRRRRASARPLTLSSDDGSAQHDRITVLSREALPLMQRVLERGVVTRADREEAARAATSLRSILVTEVGRTWLTASQETRNGPRFTIIDRSGLANEMEPTRRTVLRAMLDAFAGEPGFVGGTVRLESGTRAATLTIAAEFNAAEYTTPPGHPVVSAVLTVMSSVFTEIETSRGQASVLVKFGYETR